MVRDRVSSAFALARGQLMLPVKSARTSKDDLLDTRINPFGSDSVSLGAKRSYSSDIPSPAQGRVPAFRRTTDRELIALTYDDVSHRRRSHI